MALTTIDDRGLKTPIDLLDNEKIRFGTGNDLELFHDGASRITHTGAGNLVISTTATDSDLYLRGKDKVVIQPADGEDGVICNANGSVELYNDGTKKFETRSGGVTVTGQITASGSYSAGDSIKYMAGDGDDLQIYHDGTDNIILSNGASCDLLTYVANGELAVKAVANGTVELYYDNVKTFETISTGAIIRGTAGGDGELQLYADAGSANADLWRLKAESGAAELEIGNYASGSWEKNIRCHANNAVELYYDDSKKLETLTNGIKVTGRVQVSDFIETFTNDTDLKINSAGSSGQIKFYINGSEKAKLDSSGNFQINNDSGKITVGTGSDLKIYHDGTDSIIGNDTGTLQILSPSQMRFRASSFQFISYGNDETMAKFIDDGAVELYYDNTKVFDTQSGGARVTSGDLIIGNAGNGVLFSNWDTVANRLDDYEEGSWTPACNKSGSGFSGTVTVNSATYVKVGQLVHIQAYIGFSNDTDSSDLYITQLPFTIGGTSSHYSQMSVQTNADIEDPVLRAQGTTTELRGCKRSSNDGDQKISYTNVKDHWLIFGGTYRST